MYARIAAANLSITAMHRENIAVTSVISLIVIKENSKMENKSFERETSYQVTMNLFRQMLKQGVINKDEYNKIDTKMIEKYQPVFGTLFSEIPLT